MRKRFAEFTSEQLQIVICIETLEDKAHSGTTHTVDELRYYLILLCIK